MADNYSMETITPSIPTSACERFFLRCWGYTVKPSASGGWHIFAEGPTSDELMYEVELEYMARFAKDPICIQILEGVPDADPVSIKKYIEENFPPATILQGILKRPECADTPDIVIEGAYWCSKARQGEFGGYVTRITRDSVQYGSTTGLVAQWRGGHG